MRVRAADVLRCARIASMAVAIGCALAAPRVAAAQSTGDPMDFGVITGPAGFILVGPGGNCEGHIAAATGGATLFGASSPGGPLLGLLQRPPEIDVENQPQCPGFAIPGAPPGTYWVTVVYGLVTTVSVPLSAWKSVTVQGACTTKPSPPVLLQDQPVITGNTVSIAFGNPPACPAATVVLEAGSVPGGTDLGEVTLPTLGISAPVPSGTYYVRARGQNAFGESEPSVEVPIQVPNGCADLPQGPLNPKATLNGNVATLSWSQTPGLPNPTTFYVLTVRDPSSGQMLDNIVLFPAVTSVTSPPLSPGNYRVGIAGGNACGTTSPITGDVTFTVP